MEESNLTYYDPVPTIAPPNDDLELQLVWLHLVEQSQGRLGREDFARGWLQHIHYMWDEYGRCRWNLRRGVPIDAVGTFENPFQSSMGSPIRSELWACLFPGDSDSAAYYAALDASLDHGAEGIAGEVFFAVMQSRVAIGENVSSAIAAALTYLPAETETVRAIQLVRECFASNSGLRSCRESLIQAHANDNFTHAPLNVALTVLALLYGRGDFETTILLAVNAGYDTDCTAATAGATIGLAIGHHAIPARWSAPLGDGVFVGEGILGIPAPETLQELTDRTVAQIGKLAPQVWTDQVWNCTVPEVELERLPGTISLKPFGSETSVPWANGELPFEVKQAGGAEWQWYVSTPASQVIVCLARAGAKLFLDGQCILTRPPGQPYIPGAHRGPNATRVSVTSSNGTHQMRLELNSREGEQDACVLLTYANLHLCPWTSEELSHPALL